MKTNAIVAGAMLLLAVGTAAAQEAQAVAQPAPAAETAIKKQTVCPIMGSPVNTSIYVDANGKRVYFCCAGCPAAFKKDPAKYIKKMEKEGITLEQTPAAEPAKAPAAVTPSPAPAAKGCSAGGCCE